MDLEPVIRVGRDGRRWIAVCLIETPWGPVVVTAVGDERAVYRGVLARLREQQGGAHVGFLGGLSKLAKKAASSITRSSVVKNVAKQVSKIAKNPIVATAIKLHTSPLKLAAGALKGVTNNPLWNIAATGASFIPGVGTAVSAGMSAAAALGKGQSLKDVGLAAIKGAIPGGPVGKAAFDVALGIASGQRIDKIALNAVRNQLPGGPLAKAAFDTGLKAIQTRSLKGVPAMMAKAAVDHAGKGPLWDKLKTGAQIIPGLGATTSAGMAGAIALGRRSGVANFALSAARSALPGGPSMRAAFDAGIGIAQGKGLSATALKTVREQLPRGPAQAAFNTALTIARARPGDTGALQALQSSMPAGPLRQSLTAVAARAMRQRQAARSAYIPDIPDTPTDGYPMDAPIPPPPEPFSMEDTPMDVPGDEGAVDDAAMAVGAMEAATEIGRRLRYGDRRARARVRSVWRRARAGDPVARAAAKAIRGAMARAPMPIASKGAVQAAQAAPPPGDEPMDDIPEPPEPEGEGGEPPPPPPPASAGLDGTDALIESMGYSPDAYSVGHTCASCGHPTHVSY